MSSTARIGVIVALAGLLLPACASQGTSAHDMSASQHEEHAGAEAVEGARHLAMYDPGYDARVQRCSQDPTTTTLISPCWTELRNPTQEHWHMAQEHFERAAAHREAAAELAAAEDVACAGLEPADRDRSPFEHDEDIVSMHPVGDAAVDPEAGVAITLRPVPGLSVAWLERAIACHIARNAALGHDVPEMADCPLVPHGVRASVASTEAGFEITILASGAGSATDIQARGVRLATRIATP